MTTASKERALQLLSKRPYLSLMLIALAAIDVSPAAAQGPETTGQRGWWLPENVFPAAEQIDLLFNFILYLTSAICVAVFAVMIVFLIKYRHQPGRHGKFIKGNSKLEVVWTLIPTVILALIAVFSQATWSNIKQFPATAPGEQVVEMEVIARQFAWYFHYPGQDGKLGPRRACRAS